MNIPDRLQKFIDSPVINSDEQLTNLLLEAEELPNCALFIPNFYSGDIVYLGEGIITILGILAGKFMDEGIKLIMAHTLAEDLPRIAAEQTTYMKTVQQPNFGLSTILLQHYRWKSILPPDEIKRTQVTGVVLTFNDLREFLIGVGFIMKDIPENETLFKKCQQLLIKIKDRHNAIYQHACNGVPDMPYLIQYTNYDYQTITRREREVLGYLAKGLSTKVIAQNLQVSEHTIESHRKNLLEKFGAKNTAELIKKAAKIFWLE